MSHSVLIIDDEPLICMGLLELIDWKKFGFEKTDVCFNFTDGMRKALLYPYTLIITDIRIHDDSGLEIARTIREAKMQTRVVLISAYAEFGYARDGIKYGVDNYLLKPLRKDDIENVLANIIEDIQEKEGSNKLEANTDSEIKHSEPADSEPARFRGAADIDKLIQFIHENYNNPEISLTWFANNTYVNSSYLGQRFRQRTGLKFTDYLNQYRIVKACELLLEDKYLTYEISEKVGFGNVTYFHRMFKKITGFGTEEFKKKVISGKISLPTMQVK